MLNNPSAFQIPLNRIYNCNAINAKCLIRRQEACKIVQKDKQDFEKAAVIPKLANWQPDFTEVKPNGPLKAAQSLEVNHKCESNPLWGNP